MYKSKMIGLVLMLASVGSTASAADFVDGPIIKGYGKHTQVQEDFKVDKGAVFKVVFDVSRAGKDSTLNRAFDSVARFLNMHVANGMPLENVNLAIVVHGSASNEMLNAEAYQAKFGKPNPNIALLSKLMSHGVRVIQCGQSAAYHQVPNEKMIPGVEMALSAMTAHAVLASQGYSQNPF